MRSLPKLRWASHTHPSALLTYRVIAGSIDAYYGEGAVFVEQYMQTMHAALLDAAPYNLTNRDAPTAPFLTPRALLTSIALLKQGTAAVSTDPRRELRCRRRRWRCTIQSC